MLTNKVAIITGGASGLGRVLVDEFVSNGAKVVFTYKNSADKAKKICEKYGECVTSICADATDFAAAGAVVAYALKVFGSIDILVNNAASSKDHSLLKHNEADFDFTMKNIFYPVFNYSKAVSEAFVKQNSGCIINIGSINGIRGREGSLAYCSAKAATEGFTKTIAKELGQYNINCNVVAPGYIDTDGQVNTSEIIKNVVLNECAIRRLTNPIEVANLVVFLASEKARNITGQVYKIDCGQYI